MNLSKATKVDKDKVMYRHATESEIQSKYVCGSCLYYIDGTCELVKGSIDPEHWCRLFVTELAKDEIHMQLSRIAKEDGGGVGFGSETGGTVWTSDSPGAFTTTYGDDHKKKKKRGVDHLVDFVTESSPEQKMIKGESGSVAGHGFLGTLTSEPNWKKRPRETNTPNPVEPKMNAGEEDKADVDQNSFTNRLIREYQVIKTDKQRGSESQGGSAVGQFAFAYMKGYNLGADYDELHRNGRQDKITATEEQDYKEVEKKDDPEEKPKKK